MAVGVGTGDPLVEGSLDVEGLVCSQGTVKTGFNKGTMGAIQAGVQVLPPLVHRNASGLEDTGHFGAPHMRT